MQATTFAPDATGLVIDRDLEFDQTARSETPGPRAVSPSILEHRILMLKNEIRVANADREQLAEENAVLRKRIVGFEQMAESLSNKIDEMESTFKTLAGTTVAEFAAREITVCDTPGPFNLNCTYEKGHKGPCGAGTRECGNLFLTPNEYKIGRCIFPAEHAGGCSIGV